MVVIWFLGWSEMRELSSLVVVCLEVWIVRFHREFMGAVRFSF